MTPDQTRAPAPGSTIDTALENIEQVSIAYHAESIASEQHPDRNEDSVLTSEEDGAFGIFDGMGGHDSGQVASLAARDYVLNRIEEVANGTSVAEAMDNFERVFAGADRAVQDLREQKGGSNMGTTGVVLKVHTDDKNVNRALIANIGDSRVYKIGRGGTVMQVTEDDDVLSRSAMDPDVKARIRERLNNARTEAEAGDEALPYFNSQFLGRHNIGKCIGDGSVAKISSVEVEDGDRFLVTSDGIHDNLTKGEIDEIIRNSATLEDAAKALTERSQERAREDKTVSIRAKKDDMSAIAVKISVSKPATSAVENKPAFDMSLLEQEKAERKLRLEELKREERKLYDDQGRKRDEIGTLEKALKKLAADSPNRPALIAAIDRLQTELADISDDYNEVRSERKEFEGTVLGTFGRLGSVLRDRGTEIGRNLRGGAQRLSGRAGRATKTGLELGKKVWDKGAEMDDRVLDATLTTGKKLAGAVLKGTREQGREALKVVEDLGRSGLAAGQRKLEEQRQSIERRKRTPEFQRALAEERADARRRLGKFGQNIADAALTAIFHGPLDAFQNTWKVIADDRYSKWDYFKDIAGSFVGKYNNAQGQRKDGVLWSATKAIGNIIRYSTKKLAKEQAMKRLAYHPKMYMPAPTPPTPPPAPRPPRAPGRRPPRTPRRTP